MPLRRILLPLIVMVSPSTTKAVPERSALVTLLSENRKIKVRSFIYLEGVSWTQLAVELLSLNLTLHSGILTLRSCNHQSYFDKNRYRTMGIFSKRRKRIGDLITVKKISSINGESEESMTLGNEIDMDSFRKFCDENEIIYVSEVFSDGEPQSYLVDKTTWNTTRDRYAKIDSGTTIPEMPDSSTDTTPDRQIAVDGEENGDGDEDLRAELEKISGIKFADSDSPIYDTGLIIGERVNCKDDK
jgi:hypothetical protein